MSLRKSNRFKLLLEKGYFPEELPPPFVTYPLARFRLAIERDWKDLPPPKPFSAEIFSWPRMEFSRRRLSVVNPISQFYLSKLISENWVEIEKYIKGSNICVDPPLLCEDSYRAIPKPDFNLIGLKRLEIGSLYSHILVSDISRFYSTIYTHSVPWALHGKDWCKQNLHSKAYRESLGNKLEKALTKGQGNQTIGIPIGPDTSRILAELVAISTEKNFVAAAKIDESRVFRYVDDFFIGYDGAGEAEDAVSYLSQACGNSELELNHDKTRIIHTTDPVETLWTKELNDIKIRWPQRQQYRDIEYFFTKAFHLSKEHPKDNVLDYALKMMRSVRINPDNTKLFESYIIRTARAHSITMPTVAQLLINYKDKKIPISHHKVRKLIEDNIKTNSFSNFHGEVAWSLFLAKGLRISISKSTIDHITNMQSAVCALLTLNLRQMDLIDGSIDTSYWETFMTEDGLHSDMWLLAYEADIKGWLKNNKAHVENHKYFSCLKSRGIYFYDEKKNVARFEKSRFMAMMDIRRKQQKYSGPPLPSHPYGLISTY